MKKIRVDIYRPNKKQVESARTSLAKIYRSIFFTLLAFAGLLWGTWYLIQMQTRPDKVAKTQSVDPSVEIQKNIEETRQSIAKNQKVINELKKTTGQIHSLAFSENPLSASYVPSKDIQKWSTAATLARSNKLLKQAFGVYRWLNSSVANSLPVVVPLRKYPLISRPFGKYLNPFTGQPQAHRGVDFAGTIGDTIIAPGDGKVARVDKHRYWGNSLTLDHSPRHKTLYAHLDKVLVNYGQNVKRGQAIAILGNSGKSTGPHLHYEIHIDDIPQDPLKLMLIPRSPK